MSSKSSGLLNRIKSKSIDRLFSQSAQITTSYQYIENFENVSEEDCIKLDNINREIYKKNMELYDTINKKIENHNAMFKIDIPPQPPSEPNNHEKFISYKIRNVSLNVRHQSMAITYLIKKGYKLHFDKIENKTEYDFEPYEAIELFQKLENITVENALKNKLYEYNNKLPHYTEYTPYNENSYIYPRLSSSAPSSIPSISSIIPSAPPMSHISGPPAMHYINNK